MTRSMLSAAVVGCALAVVADAALGQRPRRNPGAPGGTGISAAANRAEYYADVMFHTNSLIEEWRNAWARDDIETVIDLYTDDALFIFNQDPPIRGREAVREELESLLKRSGEVQASVSDFDASGRMGMTSGLLTLQVFDEAGSRTLTGIHLTVLIRNGRSWAIRSQLFRLNEMETG